MYCSPSQQERDYTFSENHNSLGHERPLGLQSPDVQDTFQPIPGLISCAGVTGSVGITRHACATQMAGLRSSQPHSLVAYGTFYMHMYMYIVWYMYMSNDIIQCTSLEERRKEKKEERNERTTTASKGLEKYKKMCMHSQLQQLRKILNYRKIFTYTHPQPHPLRKIYKNLSLSGYMIVHVHCMVQLHLLYMDMCIYTTCTCS